LEKGKKSKGCFDDFVGEMAKARVSEKGKQFQQHAGDGRCVSIQKYSGAHDTQSLD
jgi:hypothetical protein